MKRKFDSQEFDGVEESDGDGVAWIRGHLLGKGGFGSVYVAESKNISNSHGYFPNLMAIKSAEISASSSLQKEKEVFHDLGFHPSIISCYGDETTTSTSGHTIYNILLEFAQGGTLSERIHQRYGGSGMPESDVRRYTRCLLKGIDYIHRHGYVHCDLKPDNVLLVRDDDNFGSFVPKIGDFGLAKGCAKSSSKRMKYDPNYVVGTALYMAPESVIDGIQERPSDIWALGCIVYEMLTGKEVWNCNPDMSSYEILQKIREHCCEYHEIPAHISEEAKGFLRGCLSRTPIFRFTAGMLLNHPFVSGISDDETGECSEEDRVKDGDHIASRCTEDEEEEDADIELGSASRFSKDKNFTNEEEYDDDIELGCASRYSQNKIFSDEEEEDEDIELGCASRYSQDKSFTDEEEDNDNDDTELGSASRLLEDKSWTYEEDLSSYRSHFGADDGVINRKRRRMLNENLLDFPKPGVMV
ncbi:Protein kinase superfamily protein [Euphorbia peplus]|nr:Protein kinase superfamily protein [Euphorbia peplus]